MPAQTIRELPARDQHHSRTVLPFIRPAWHVDRDDGHQVEELMAVALVLYPDTEQTEVLAMRRHGTACVRSYPAIDVAWEEGRALQISAIRIQQDRRQEAFLRDQRSQCDQAAAALAE